MSRSTPGQGMAGAIPLLKLEDINGIVYLVAGNIGAFIFTAATLIGMGWPEELVFYRVIPGMTVGLLVQAFYYSWMAWRLAKKEGRSDVTALPYGVSTPVMFIYLFSIIMPLQYGLNLPPEQVWQAAVAACFVGGVVEALGAVIGPYVRKILPRAAMLATIAGISLVWIASKGLYDVYALPELGMPVLILAILGLIGGYMLPGKIPPLLISFVIGVIYALALGEASIVTEELGRLSLPVFSISNVVEGFHYIVPFLSIIIPIEIYNFIETMDNVESASAAGDNYHVGEAQLVDGLATMISALFGGVIPNTVWLGHPGLKRSDCGIGYAWTSGIVFFIAACLGLMNFIYHLIPEVLVAITYLWSALVMISQAFVDVPRRHFAAVAIAFVPHLANYVYTEVMGALSIVDIWELTPEISNKLIEAGVMWGGVEALNSGSILTGMIWAAILVYIIDRCLDKAGHACLVASALTFFGMLHTPEMGINAGPLGLTLGYLSMGIICYLSHFFRDKLDVPRRFDYV